MTPYGEESNQYKLRAHLEDVRPKIGGRDSFDPILDSWQISVMADKKEKQ